MINLGFSGDLIEIKGKYLYKTCKTDQNRFLLNINKQKNFNNPYIQSVPILQEGINNQEHYIKMPYIQCENPLIWLSRAELNQVQAFISIIINYFNHSVINSQVKIFNKNIWDEKLILLKKSIHDVDLINVINRLFQLDETYNFYYGNYHGDFTLSNLFIIENNGAICVEAIDFLEVFIASPINDLVKIRQDTKHLWTYNLLKNQNIDKNRILIILSYLDKEIEKIINGNFILKYYYLFFQTLNLLRIVPYNNDPENFSYLKKEIMELAQCLP